MEQRVLAPALIHGVSLKKVRGGRNYVKIKKYNGNDMNRMSIFSVKDGYKCSIVISDTTDFGAACAVFEEF